MRKAMTIARRAYLRWRSSFTYLSEMNGTMPNSPLRVESFDALIGQGQAIAGSPETVRAFLAAQIEDSKANYIVGQFCFGDLTLEEMLRSVELFATKVKPALQAALVMKTAIVNLGVILTGDWRDPVAAGNSIVMDGGKIAHVGTAAASQIAQCDVVIDADGATAIPGLIDSHVHITFGDYTPRQRTVGFLESYVHGGTTTSISASEVHVPGRPKDPEGVKALAVAAMKCFESYRPGGMRVCAGSVILEPGLDRARLRRTGGQGRVACQGGLRRVRHAVRVCADGPLGQEAWHDHDGVTPAALRFPAPRASGPIISSPCSRTCRFTSTAARSPCPIAISRGW